MFSMAGAGVIMTSRETGPEQLPADAGLAPADPGPPPADPGPAPADPGRAPAEAQAPTQREPLRPLAVAECSLCGVALPLGLLVPDGGPGCADIHWYCKDAKSCTERWTTARPPQHPHPPAVPGPAAAPAERLDGVLEGAPPAGTLAWLMAPE